MPDTPSTDVLIVGAGPTGATLALDLTRRGVAVRIIDKADHGFDGSRAKGLQPRTLEVFNDLGVLDEILKGGSTYPMMGIHLGPITLPLQMLDSPHTNDDGVPYPHTWLIPQFRTDRVLRDRLKSQGVVVEYQRELVDLTQTPDLVTASVHSPDGPETIAARYVVGADGAASAVRKSIGIGFVGSTDEADRVLIVDSDVRGGLSRNRWHIWLSRRGLAVASCPLPHGDQFQWFIKLAPDETAPQTEDQITTYLRARTGSKRLAVHNITWKSVFRPNIRLAESYRSGRVFIAGDAAHAHTPAGGQGLNTGVQDGYNLGWKLSQVLAGAPPELLDTYEAERLPIAAGVLGLSTKKYAGMTKFAPSSIKRGKDEQQIALTYRGGPLAPLSSTRTATLAVGDRAPDAHLNDHGTPVQLFDLYRGPHFTALAYGPSAIHDLSLITWPTSGARLQRIAVRTSDNEAEHADRSLQDTNGNFSKNYGLSGDAIILIRPDGYIASIATQDLRATTATAIGRITPSV